MDSITHILVGATIGLAVRNEGMPRKLALFTGALACTAPDFDVFIFSRHNPLIQELVHRSFSHSLLFIPFGAFLVAAFILILFKSSRPNWKHIFLIAVIAYASHAPLDACTSYGTQLFWPFSNDRVSFDFISIVDPVFTGILLIGLLFAYYRKSKKIVIGSLMLALLYLCFCVFQHARAITLLKNLAPSTALYLRALPELGSQYTWDGLYCLNHKAYIVTIHTLLFAKASLEQEGSVTLFERLPSNLLSDTELSNAAATFQWFSQGYSAVADTRPYTLVDLRYLSKAKVLTSHWGIVLVQDGNKGEIIKQRNIPLSISG